MLACAASAGAGATGSLDSWATALRDEPAGHEGQPLLHARSGREDAAFLQAQVPDDPDALYRDRDRPASAARAEAVWAARLAASPSDFEAAWKLARLCYWTGTEGPGDQAARRRALDAGMTAARAAIAARPDAPDGHFWLAATMGALAESHGLRQGLRYRGAIKAELERVLALDAAYLQGSADRALGRWYLKVPGLFGGSRRKSEEHLRKALAYNPQSIITRVFLAETLIEDGREPEARRELQAALDAPIDPEWAPEDRRYKERAGALMATIGR
jgi:tetratricopeptide (TPR) repeat protein